MQNSASRRAQFSQAGSKGSFGTIGWKTARRRKKSKKDDDQPKEVTDADVLFQLTDANSSISFGGKVVTVGSVVLERRSSNGPDATVQYHKICDQPSSGKPGWFALELATHIYFRAEDVPSKGEEGVAKIPHHHLAGCLKADVWDTPGSQVVWAMKWSPTALKGLTPIRPMVVATTDLKIPAHSALELTAKAADDEKK